MHDTLRRRIMRRLETLPDAQLYQVLDYIEFLESRYARGTPTDASGLQRLAEKIEDGLRKRTLNPSNLREAFQLISVADRVLDSVSEAGRQIMGELQGPGESVRDSRRSGSLEPRGGTDTPERPPTAPARGEREDAPAAGGEG
jgi:hypothetical protein